MSCSLSLSGLLYIFWMPLILSFSKLLPEDWSFLFHILRHCLHHACLRVPCKPSSSQSKVLYNYQLKGLCHNKFLFKQIKENLITKNFKVWHVTWNLQGSLWLRITTERHFKHRLLSLEWLKLRLLWRRYCSSAVVMWCTCTRRAAFLWRSVKISAPTPEQLCLNWDAKEKPGKKALPIKSFWLILP